MAERALREGCLLAANGEIAYVVARVLDGAHDVDYEKNNVLETVWISQIAYSWRILSDYFLQA